MKVEPIQVNAFVIFDAPRLDPVTVILQEGTGRGSMTVTCYGMAWTAYWGAIGDKGLSAFLAGCDVPYVMEKLRPNDRKVSKSEAQYLGRIVQAVLAALTPNVQDQATAEGGSLGTKS